MWDKPTIGGHIPLHIALFSLGLIGVAILLYSTVWGIGVSPDSVRYIDAARNLATRHALVERQIEQEIQDLLSLELVKRGADGAIYRAKRRPESP